MVETKTQASGRAAIATVASLLLVVPFGATTFGSMPESGRLTALLVFMWVALPGRVSLVALGLWSVAAVTRRSRKFPPAPRRVHVAALGAAVVSGLGVILRPVEYLGVFVPFLACLMSVGVSNWTGSTAREAGAATLRHTMAMDVFRPTSDALARLLSLRPDEVAGIVFGHRTTREAAAMLYVVLFVFGGAAAAAGVEVPPVPGAAESHAGESTEIAEIPSPGAPHPSRPGSSGTLVPPNPIDPRSQSPGRPTTTVVRTPAECEGDLRVQLLGHGLSRASSNAAISVLSQAGFANTGCIVGSVVAVKDFELVTLAGNEQNFGVLLGGDERAVLIYPRALPAVRAAIGRDSTTSLEGQFANTIAGLDDGDRRSFIYVVNEGSGCRLLVRNAGQPSFVELPSSVSASVLKLMEHGYVQARGQNSDGGYVVETYAKGTSRRTGTHVVSGTGASDAADCGDRTHLLAQYPDGQQFVVDVE